MKLIAGLGNPGSNYADTYHNVGFMTLGRLSERFDVGAFRKDKLALVSDTAVNGEKIMLIEPQTYMNLSGDAVSHYAKYYKLAPKDILVVYDDIDIPRGTVRARTSGSAGTHNGMRDIVAKLGSCDFARVRVGIGLKPNYMELADYVLSRIPAEWQPTMDKAFAAACGLIEQWIKGEPWTDMTVTVT